MSTSTSNRDRDCAFLARAALFPLQLNRADALRSASFPALEALGRVRDEAISVNPNLASSSFYPKHVVVVSSVNETNYGQLQWNGRPDIVERDASFDVIPRMLSVRCMECDANAVRPGLDAFAAAVKGSDNTGGGEHGTEHREIVLCSDRLVKADCKSGNVKELPSRSYRAVEEALAREITKVRDRVKSDRGGGSDCSGGGGDSPTCKEVAASEIRAALAAECYFSKAGTEPKRGSRLPPGYSLLPASLRRSVMGRCVRSVATKATETEFGRDEGRKCVADAFDKTMDERNAE